MIKDKLKPLFLFFAAALAFVAGPALLPNVDSWGGHKASAAAREDQSLPVAQTQVPDAVSHAPVLLTEGERAWLREHPVITVAHDPGWPPIEFSNERGKLSGMSGDYLRLVEQQLGVTFQRVENLSWQEVYARQKHWEIDMATCVAETPPRREFWAFTPPYLTIPIVIATQTDVTYIADMKELFGKKVALVESYAVDDWITKDLPEIHLVRVQSPEEGLALLQRGEVFAYIDSLLIIGYYQAKMKMTGIKIAGDTPYENAQCMAVRKDWAPLAGIIQKALESISEKERNDIYRKWLPIRYEHGFNHALFWRVLVVFALIVFGLILWNRKLSGEIRHRREAEAALRKSENFLSSIFRVAPTGIGVVRNRVLLTVNDRICAMTGYSREELVGQNARMLYVSEADFDYVGTEKYRQIQAHGTGTVETHWQCKDGRNINVLLSSTPINPVDLSSGVTFTALDITDRKRAEEEREKIQSQLLQAQKMESVGLLAGGVAHDYNNILGVILGYADLSLETLDPSQPLYKNLQEIRNAAIRSAEITRQLLAFARKQTVAPMVITLNAAIEGMLKMLRRLIGEDIDLAWLPGVNLWPIKVDPAQIDQIFTNLCINARDAIQGVGKITIETNNTVIDEAYCANHLGFIPGEFVLLAVSDSGNGMDKETLDKIFEPFFTTKDVGRGTGLGMATVYGIVKQNNGFINVYSEPGEGTTFKIYLPRHEGKTEPIPEKSEIAPDSQGRETVLLLEDDPSILEMTTMILQRLGYTVLAASTPGEAIRLAETRPGEIDLLITDVIMPEMNGRDLARQLMSRDPRLRCLFMSGYTANVIAHRGVLDEGVNFIQKPFSMKNLATIIRKTLLRERAE